ncbi:MAG: NADPH-dependent 7-cyano-7-deazaguanine reductase QueF [Culturomica sp.]|jgi:7-cyano-7-deazaguanine reductase|nr:NADPH-dependent 7-cyano-7-deazaguanine reductase QueF [Culturomica sp.]
MNNDVLLGKNIAFPQRYCKDILRKMKRGTSEAPYGFDCWYAHEVSFLTSNGMPVVGVLKIVYPSNSEYIIESKSLKLYLASFNMEKLGEKWEITGVQAFTDIIKRDLEEVLECEVKVYLHTDFPIVKSNDFTHNCKRYPALLERTDGADEWHFDIYNEHPSYLEVGIDKTGGEMEVCTHLLRSNCRITNQPDWGSVFFHIKGKQLPSNEALLKYVVSLRNENLFHEDVCELIYKRIFDIFTPELLTVCCIYAMRGGIDIRPVRSNTFEDLPRLLISETVLTAETFRQ